MIKNFDYPITLDDITSECLIIFTSKNCEACALLEKEIKEIDFDCYLLDECSGSQIGPGFSIMSSPTTLYIKSKNEIDRFYGKKSKEFILNFIKSNHMK